MNQKDVSEIRRRLTPDKGSTAIIRGCYVSAKGEIISTFNRSPLSMPQEEAEKYMALFKRGLSGSIGESLLPVDFSPEQVQSGEEYALLSALRKSELKDDDAARRFFDQIIAGLHMEDHYLILCLHDVKEARADEVFHYILCCVCPVKLTKPALSYDASENDFRSREPDWIVGAPETGFLFPAFEDGGANIYGALLYTRDTANAQEEFLSCAMGVTPVMPAAEQKETLQDILQSSLNSECSLNVVQAVHGQVREMMETQAEDKEAAPPRVGKREIKAAMESCGVSEKKIADFEEQYDEAFGENAALDAVNVISPKKFELRTPHVSIKVDPGRSDLIETRVIDGLNYILIRADEGVEVNGLNVRIAPLS